MATCTYCEPRKKCARCRFRYQMELNFASEDDKQVFLSRMVSPLIWYHACYVRCVVGAFVRQDIEHKWTWLYSNLNLSDKVKGCALGMCLLYPQSARSQNYRATYDLPRILV